MKSNTESYRVLCASEQKQCFRTVGMEGSVKCVSHIAEVIPPSASFSRAAALIAVDKCWLACVMCVLFPLNLLLMVLKHMATAFAL